MERLVQSCSTHKQYPDSLSYSKPLRPDRTDYKYRLEEQVKNRLFVGDGQAALEFLQCGDFDGTSQQFFSSQIKDLDELSKGLKRTWEQLDKKEAYLSHIFVYAKTSRDPLQISLDMLTYLLTYYRIPPTFLEFLFSTVFRTRRGNYDAYFSGVDAVHQLALPQLSQAFPNLGRSGRILRLSYNLRAAKERPRELGLRKFDFTWSIETVAIHHVFDVETGHSMWLTCDSNAKFRNHIKEWVSRSREIDLHTVEGRFSATLATHLTICDWAVQNWRWYLKAVEDEIETIALETRTFDLGGNNLRQDFKVARMGKQQSWPLHIPERRETANAVGTVGLESIEIHSTSRPSPGSRLASAKKDPPQPILQPDVPPPPPPPIITKEDKELSAFEDMQQVDLLEDQARESLLVLSLNIGVLDELLEQYEALANNTAFPEQLGRGENVDFVKFSKNMKKTKARFEQLVGRTKKILVQLDHRRNSTFFLIQYRNMRQSRESAIEMENMTKNMEQVATKTQQEAISMRIITLVTLFFLPATSIATIFGSGIVSFERNDTWTAGKHSIYLFLSISLPLTFGTFLVWWIMMNGVYKVWVPEYLKRDAEPPKTG